MNRPGPSRTTLVLIASLAAFSPTAADLPIVNVGIVIDGPIGPPSPGHVRKLLSTEFEELMRAEYDMRMPEDKTTRSDGTVEGIGGGLNSLLEDDDIHLVIAAGPIASHLAGTWGPLPKPVIAPLVINPLVQGVPLEGDVSGVENLSYITFPSNVQKDLETCIEVVPFKKAALLFSRSIGDAIPELWDHYLSQGEAAGIVGVPVPVDDNAAAVLQAIGDDVEAVFVALRLGLPADEFTKLVTGLNERRLPSFSALGEEQVQAGLLVGLHLDSDISRLARRVALNVQRILGGEKPGQIPVVFTRSEQVTINMATARTIDVYPKWGVMTEAQLIHEEKKKTARQWTLVEAVREAVKTNRELLANALGVQAGAEEVRQARAQLLPQVDLDGTGVAVDADIANAIQPEKNLTGKATVSQLLYSEAARANHAIQGHLQKGRGLAQRELELDVVQAAATAYLNVLRALSFEAVQKKNLESTRENLELARVRRTVGMSGPADVFRWESQIALDRKNLIRANAERNVAEIELNRVLHRPLEEAFHLRETGLHDDGLITHEARFIQYIESKSRFGRFREFMVQDGLASSVELQQLDAAIAARERALASAKSAYWSPTLAVQGDVANEFYDDGAGSEVPLDEANWTLGLSLSSPLYSGGSKGAAKRQSDAALQQLRLQRQAVAERVEQRIRTALHRSMASYAAIDLSSDAAVAAAQTHQLVKDAYERGLASNLDLIDAKNADIIALQGTSNAIFDFLVDLMAVERGIGKFYFFAPQAFRDEWFGRLEAFFVEAE